MHPPPPHKKFCRLHIIWDYVWKRKTLFYGVLKGYTYPQVPFLGDEASAKVLLLAVVELNYYTVCLASSVLFCKFCHVFFFPVYIAMCLYQCPEKII